MLRRVTLMLTLAAIATVVVLTVGAGRAPAASPTLKTCDPAKVCKGTSGPDWIFGSTGNDNIRPFGGNDYVFGNGGDDVVAHSYGEDRIFGGCGGDTLRGGFDLDRIYANMPDSWINMTVSRWDEAGRCASVTKVLAQNQPAQITALAEAVGRDVPDGARDLVDCAYLDTRGDPLSDAGYGQYGTSDVVSDVVVDCSNRDDQ